VCRNNQHMEREEVSQKHNWGYRIRVQSLKSGRRGYELGAPTINRTECMTFTSLEQAIDFLKTNGHAIGEQARNGNKTANAIIGAYTMVYNSPGDPGTQGLLLTLLERYTEGRSRRATQP
jgi:hypothetical protein